MEYVCWILVRLATRANIEAMVMMGMGAKAALIKLVKGAFND
jgi:hypothetical protein